MSCLQHTEDRRSKMVMKHTLATHQIFSRPHQKLRGQVACCRASGPVVVSGVRVRASFAPVHAMCSCTVVCTYNREERVDCTSDNYVQQVRRKSQIHRRGLVLDPWLVHLQIVALHRRHLTGDDLSPAAACTHQHCQSPKRTHGLRPLRGRRTVWRLARAMMVCMVQLAQLGVSAPELPLREGELDGRPCRQMREVFRHSSRESSRDGSEPGPEGFHHLSRRLCSWREQTAWNMHRFAEWTPKMEYEL